MAATDARPIPWKSAAYRVTFPLFDADGDLVTGAAGLDSEVSLDGGTFTDCTNEATEIATSSGVYYLDLTAAEMSADTVAIIVKTSTAGAKTTPIVLYPVETGDIPVNTTQISGDTTAADNCESFFDGTGYAGTNNVIPTVTTLTGHTAQTGDAFARLGAPAGASVSADVAAVKGETAAILDDTGTAGVVVAAGSKTGYKLASDGLDSVTATEPTGKPTTFAGWVMWLVQRFRRADMTATTLTVKTEAGATVTTQSVSDDGVTQSIGAPS